MGQEFQKRLCRDHVLHVSLHEQSRFDMAEDGREPAFFFHVEPESLGMNTGNVVNTHNNLQACSPSRHTLKLSRV